MSAHENTSEINNQTELAKSYEPASVEAKWQKFWAKNKCFEVSNPLEAEFSIAFPPPNVTGELHMGHALNGTLQDVLIRYHRMRGKKVHWQIGSDHAASGRKLWLKNSWLKKAKINTTLAALSLKSAFGSGQTNIEAALKNKCLCLGFRLT